MRQYAKCLNKAYGNAKAEDPRLMKRDLQQFCGVSPRTVTEWFYDRVEPSRENKDKILAFFKLKESEFIKLGELSLAPHPPST